jgi:hypothetical protein
MADVGTDISTFLQTSTGEYVPGLSPDFAVISGSRVVGEAIARRLITPRGTLAYDLDYGLDLRAYLNDDLGPTDLYTLGSLIEAEAEKDERVMAAEATLTLDRASSRLRVQLLLTIADAVFTLTLSIDQLSLTVLRFQ